MSAIAVPENSKDNKFPFGITILGRSDEETLVTGLAELFLRTEDELLAVCGLHKKGYPLESQLTSLGAEFEEHTETAKAYHLYRLSMTPVKPGLVRVCDNTGENIAVDLFSISKEKLGVFMDHVNSPLTIGSITLKDGRVVKGFLCEEYAAKNAENITEKKQFL